MKLKRLLKLNKKPTVIFIYGSPAAGKLTVAKELKKVTGYNLFHNHMIIDLVKSVISESSVERTQIREDILFQVLSLALKKGNNIIMTHAYASNYIALNKTKDSDYALKLEKLVKSYKGKFCPVFLIPKKEEILKRISLDSRKNFGKLTSVKEMKKYFKIYDFYTQAPVKNNLIIDNTKISPKKVALMIRESFDL